MPQRKRGAELDWNSTRSKRYMTNQQNNNVHQVLENAAISCDVQDFDETELPQAMKSHSFGSIYDNKCDFCQD